MDRGGGGRERVKGKGKGGILFSCCFSLVYATPMLIHQAQINLNSAVMRSGACDAAGLGNGVVGMSSTIAVSFYFDKRRSVAVGIALCGTGVGIFAFAPIINALLVEYSWKGTVLIEAGIFLNCVVCGMLFRPLNVRGETHRRTRVARAEDQRQLGRPSNLPVLPPASDDRERRRRYSESDKTALSRVSSAHLAPHPMTRRDLLLSVSPDWFPQHRAERDEHACGTTEQSGCQADEAATICSDQHNEDPANVVERGQLSLNARSASAPDLPQLSAVLNVARRRPRGESESSTILPTLSGHLVSHTTTRKDGFDTASYERIPENVVDGKNDFSSDCGEKQPEPLSDGRWLARIGGVAKTLSRTVSSAFRLFLDSVFVLFAISTVLTGMGFVVPYVFLFNRGLSLGFDGGRSAWLISAVGISNTVGRLVFGFIAGIERVSSLVLYSTALVLCGICSLFSGLLASFPLQLCYALCFGFLSCTLSPLSLVHSSLIFVLFYCTA